MYNLLSIHIKWRFERLKNVDYKIIRLWMIESRLVKIIEYNLMIIFNIIKSIVNKLWRLSQK